MCVCVCARHIQDHWKVQEFPLARIKKIMRMDEDVRVSTQLCFKTVHAFEEGYRLYANKTEDLINERIIDFACIFK